MEKNPTDYLDAMILRQSEIDKGETIEVASATAEVGITSFGWERFGKLKVENNIF